jgi:Eukaryotic aspartyl protease
LTTNAAFVNGLNDSNAEFLKSIDLDGVFGLGLTTPGNPQGYVWTLYNNGIINFPRFILYFQHDSLNVYFGNFNIEGYGFNYLRNVLVAPATNNSSYWSIPVSSITIGNFSILTKSVILSISYKNILADAESFENIWNYYQSIGGCVTNQSFIFCNQTGGSLNLKINSGTLTIPENVLWVSDGSLYTLLIKNDTKWVLGPVFLKNFLTVFSYEPLTVSFLSKFPLGSTDIQVIYI